MFSLLKQTEVTLANPSQDLSLRSWARSQARGPGNEVQQYTSVQQRTRYRVERSKRNPMYPSNHVVLCLSQTPYSQEGDFILDSKAKALPLMVSNLSEGVWQSQTDVRNCYFSLVEILFFSGMEIPIKHSRLRQRRAFEGTKQKQTRILCQIIKIIIIS